MIETAALILDLPPGELVNFAVTMALTIAFGYVLVCGTGRPR